MAHLPEPLEQQHRQLLAMYELNRKRQREFKDHLQHLGIETEDAEARFQSYPPAVRQEAEAVVQALLSGSPVPALVSAHASTDSSRPASEAAASRVLRGRMGSRV